MELQVRLQILTSISKKNPATAVVKSSNKGFFEIEKVTNIAQDKKFPLNEFKIFCLNSSLYHLPLDGQCASRVGN